MTDATPVRDKTGKFIKTLDGAERDREAATLRTMGWTFRQIAEHMGYAAESSAYRAYQRALAAVPVEAVQELRATSVARLDVATRKVFEVLLRRHMLAQNGRVAVDPTTSQPLMDDGPLLAAVDRLVKLEERRAKLLGLDSPAKVDVAVSDAMDQKIKELLAEMDHPVVEDVPQPELVGDGES